MQRSKSNLNTDNIILERMRIIPPPTPPQLPKKVLQVEIFQGEKKKVKDQFNKFMLDNIDNDLEIYQIDTDEDNSYVSKITVYFYAKLKNKG